MDWLTNSIIIFSRTLDMVHINGLDNSIQSHSVKDIYRLGKFSQHLRRPRPLLVKLIRVADVSSVLSKRGLLSHPVFININPGRKGKGFCPPEGIVVPDPVRCCSP